MTESATTFRLMPRGVQNLLFPNGVRVWHFIVLPASAMGLLIWVSREIDFLVLPWFMRNGYPDVYLGLRSVVVALMMSSLIAFLAFSYRSAYEAKLQARNEVLEATREFLTRIIEGSAEAIITRDIAGRVTSWNPAAEAIYGWSAEEMLGQGVERIIPSNVNDAAERERLEARLSAGESVRGYEARRLRKDGKGITVSITTSPLYDRQGRRVGSAGIVRDITELKEMEARLLERERLAAVGELAAMVAHEVRNPLAGIRGGCELMLEGYPEGDPKHEIGREVLHQVDRLNRTVQDLLMFARPKAMDPVPTDVHGLIERLVHVLQEDDENQRIAFEREYGENVPVVVVDARQMEQVFLNLMLNACQAMHHQGVVTIETRTLGTEVEVVVRDSGPGIAADKLEHIFKPFFTTRSQGTGLGLSICKKIVDAHGGRIEASSPSGGGARFTVTLPARTA